MSDDAGHGGDRQQRISQRTLPQLVSLAEDLEFFLSHKLPAEIPHSTAGIEVMPLTFVAKQREHLRSVHVLVDAGQHRDAFLIARTMLEGLGYLLWAFKETPERTNLWFRYGFILDWRETQNDKKAGRCVDPAEEARLQAYVDQYGPRYETQKVRNARAKAEKNGQPYQSSADPWVKRWHTVESEDGLEILEIKDILTEAIGEGWYDVVYDDASRWVHWAPQALIGAIASTESDARHFAPEDWHRAWNAVYIGCLVLWRSLLVLNFQFALDLDHDLEEVGRRLKPIEDDTQQEED